MFVCRQLYAEVRMLLFQLNIFYVNTSLYISEHIGRLGQLLTSTQTNAITTIRLYICAIRNLQPETLFGRGQFKGLKRVIIWGCTREVKFVSSFVQHCTPSNLEVKFDTDA
jgi:hypothetical protein